MKSIYHLNFSELRCSYESDDSCFESDCYDDIQLPRKKGWLYEHLDDATQYELNRQLTELGLEPTKFICTFNNNLYYGNLLIIGDLIYDLLTSTFGLYNFEVDSGVIYSERATF